MSGTTILTRLAALLALLALVACASEIDIGQPVDVIIVPSPSPAATAESSLSGVAAAGTVLERLTENTDFALFVAGWTRIGRSAVLQDGGPFTVFAPTNVAFTRLGTTTMQMAPAELESLLRQHVIAGARPPEELAAAGAAETSAGATVRVAQRDGTLTVDYATVIGDPIVADNGIIYPVDAVLLPPETGPQKSLWGAMLDDERLSALVAAMGGTDTMYRLRFSQEPDAFLAPTNEAMAAGLPPELAGLPRTDPAYDALFAYHTITANGWPLDDPLPLAEMVARGVVETPLRDPAQFGLLYTVGITQQGEDVFANDARIVAADIPAANGMLHLIDRVLRPPSFDH